MQKKIGIFGLLLLSTYTQAAIDANFIKSEAASVATLAGRVGEAATLSVQADDDDDLEILTTVSSDINNKNDYWILLDWDGTDYKIINTGSLQPSGSAYLTSYQVSHTKVLLGQQNGTLTTITFNNNELSEQHDVDEQQTLLGELPHVLNSNMDINTDIKAIVKLEGTDQQDYTVLCTSNLTHILANDRLEFTLEQGGYCQSGNIDYIKLDENYDQELITEDGLYFTFDGTDWQEKTGLATSVFGESFLVANIDKDDADEILSQSQTEQVQSFSPDSHGPWVSISVLEDAKNNFNTIDIDGDGVHEIFFDSQAVDSTYLNKVSWDSVSESHTITSIETQGVEFLKIKHLATGLSAGDATNFYLFASKADTSNPNTQLLTRLNQADLSITWEGLFATKARSFDVIVKIQPGESIKDYNLVQLEQVKLGVDDYKYAYKFLSASNFSFESIVEPNFSAHEVTSVNSLMAFDFNNSDFDELHAGGQAGFLAKQGIVISSNLDGSDHNILNTPSIEAVTALSVDDINLDNASTPDIIATGKNTATNSGIAIHELYDGFDELTSTYIPSSGDTDFNSIIAINIKGEDELDVLGLHSQLVSYSPSANSDESIFYNLSNLDLAQFTPVAVKNSTVQHVLASDTAGMLYLIEGLDFDILAKLKACDSELSAIISTLLNDEVTIAAALCGQQLLSWVIEKTPANKFQFHALTTHEIVGQDTSGARLITLQTTEGVEPDAKTKTHLFALFDNSFRRYELNRNLAVNSDDDDYYNYQDEFPRNSTQWADTDKDHLGDNPEPALNFDPLLKFDPSPNDIDNDGVSDATDPDNNPINDLDPSNDTDNGLPSFNNTPFELVTAQYDKALTNISFPAPTAQDLYDDFIGNNSPTISATVNGTALSVLNGAFEASLPPGKHYIVWQARDVRGNVSTEKQEVWVYPSIAFDTLEQRVGENQTAQIKVRLNGPSPGPITVDINVTGGDISNDDVTEDIGQTFSISFNEGETESYIELGFVSDQDDEGDETIKLTIQDTFDSTAENPNWTIDNDRNVTTLTVADLNVAPVIGESGLIIKQNGIVTLAPNNIDGSVKLSVDVSDAENPADSHSYNWNLSSLGLGITLLPTASFDAKTIQPGLYSISVSISDDGLPRLATTKSFSLTIGYGDSDGDGVKDNIDAFPADPDEQLDSDGDGVGDKADAFPRDPNEQLDSDGDNVGDKADAFPNNANESKDTDNDGVGDNADVFPTDPLETLDSDGDEVGDKADSFPNNANESKDTDNDGVGDNADVFPTDPRETKDSDGDGVGDNTDVFPTDDTKSRQLDDQSLEDNGAGSLHYFLMLLLLPLVLTRTRTK